MNDTLLTVNEVAARLRYSRWTVTNLIAAGKKGDPRGLPAMDISSGNGGETGRRRPTWRISEAALQQWQESRQDAA